MWALKPPDDTGMMRRMKAGREARGVYGGRQGMGVYTQQVEATSLKINLRIATRKRMGHFDFRRHDNPQERADGQ